MYIRRASKILTLTGIVLFLFMQVGVRVIAFYLPGDTLSGAVQSFIVPVVFGGSILSLVLFFVGIVFRFLAPKSSTNPLVGQTNSTPVQSTEEADFGFWRNAIAFGFIIWFMALLGTAMAFDSGQSFSAYTLLFFHLGALPVSIISLIVAYIKRKTNISQAVFVLKIPFYYFMLGVVILIFSSYVLDKYYPMKNATNTNYNYDVPIIEGVGPPMNERIIPSPAYDQGPRPPGY